MVYFQEHKNDSHFLFGENWLPKYMSAPSYCIKRITNAGTGCPNTCNACLLQAIVLRELQTLVLVTQIHVCSKLLLLYYENYKRCTVTGYQNTCLLQAIVLT